MIKYVGITGKIYQAIEPAITAGGEGFIYKIEGMPEYVLKISKKPTEILHRKLLTMIGIQLPQKAKKQMTWPIDIVYQNNVFCGYVMMYLKDRDILNIVNANNNYTFKQKITIAKNICAVINSLHNVGQVCGDLNPKNITVNPKTQEVTLVDTDSFHITDYKSNRIYRCEVGMPLYLAKEIQEEMKKGYNLKNVPVSPYSKETDLFALAVNIFSLLMNGCHPYACATNGVNNIQQLTSIVPSIPAPQPNENIINGFFPFYMKKTGITIPKYAPEFDTIPKEIQNLFIRAFVNGNNNPSDRPTATEWFHALERMQGNLTTCSKNQNHIYNADLKQCPWCKIEEKMKKILQPKPKTQPVIPQVFSNNPSIYTGGTSSRHQNKHRHQTTTKTS